MKTQATNFITIAILIIMLALAACCTHAQNMEGPVQPKPVESSDPFEQNRALGRGVNLGNALEAPSEGEWGMMIQEEYLQLIKDAGFSSVRIPVRWNAHALQEEPFTIEEYFFERVDKVIGWALERNLQVVLNIHHYNALMEAPAQHRRRFLAIWRQISGHYRGYPDNLLFEVLNEPHGHLTPGLWNRYLRDAIGMIRETNPNRTLVIGTAPWGGIDGLKDLSLPHSERNVIVTVHYYEPFRFTHQNAGWVEGSEAWDGTTWTGTEEQKKAVESDFNFVQNWAEQHKRPVFVGEFGAYSAAPRESRERWTKYVRQTMEKRGFSWAYWEFGAGFGIYDRENDEWRIGLLEALIPE